MSDKEYFRRSFLSALGGYRCAQSVLATEFGLNDKTVMAYAALDALDLRMINRLEWLGGMAGEW